MVPSLSLTLEPRLSEVDESRHVIDSSLTGNEQVTPIFRSRRALLTHAHGQLKQLAQRQMATDMEPYRLVLRLLGTLVTDGSPTPQIGDNGEGGVAVEWLVDGNLLRLDYEDENEILITATNSRGDRVLCATITKWWLDKDTVVVEAREYLRGLAGSVTRPLPLG